MGRDLTDLAGKFTHPHCDSLARTPENAYGNYVYNRVKPKLLERHIAPGIGLSKRF